MKKTASLSKILLKSVPLLTLFTLFTLFTLLMKAPLAYSSHPFISCQSEGDTFQLHTSSDLSSAFLKTPKTVEPFGNLTCDSIFTREVRYDEFHREVRPVLTCRTPFIADAGYHVFIYQLGPSFELKGTVSEDSIAGPKNTVQLDCVKNELN